MFSSYTSIPFTGLLQTYENRIQCYEIKYHTIEI